MKHKPPTTPSPTQYGSVTAVSNANQPPATPSPNQYGSVTAVSNQPPVTLSPPAPSSPSQYQVFVAKSNSATNLNPVAPTIDRRGSTGSRSASRTSSGQYEPVSFVLNKQN